VRRADRRISRLNEAECLLMLHCCTSQAYWLLGRKSHGSTVLYLAMFHSSHLAVLFSWMLVVVTFGIDNRFELVKAGHMGKLREPLSLPLRELTSVLSVRTVLPFVYTNSHANRMASGEVEAIPGTSFRGLSVTHLRISQRRNFKLWHRGFTQAVGYQIFRITCFCHFQFLSIVVKGARTLDLLNNLEEIIITAQN